MTRRRHESTVMVLFCGHGLPLYYTTSDCTKVVYVDLHIYTLIEKKTTWPKTKQEKTVLACTKNRKTLNCHGLTSTEKVAHQEFVKLQYMFVYMFKCIYICVYTYL